MINLGSKALGGRGREVTVVVVGVSEEDALDGAVANHVGHCV